MNKTMLIGRVVAAPEIVKTPTDKSVTRTTVAVNRRFKNQNGEREADFISVVFWGKTAETFATYAQKGILVSVEGEIRTRSYTDKQEQKRYITEVLGLTYDLLESRATIARRANHTNSEEITLDAEELPF
ncbi:single-stranded DNA-binding protein [Lactococcus nasutitermitis]|uniref:Single-stranded DNA-binding protein n=1 Tax=Lactococcus nasutitermitis TaxID=1652957 RepID=A0ABV9JAG5_9LACT|nr:single-stranded DNA-binding protein [Lactococcus nasutitermitis]